MHRRVNQLSKRRWRGIALITYINPTGQAMISAIGRRRDQLLKAGLASDQDLDEMIQAWKDWAAADGSSESMMQGEIIVQM